jgi:sugar phosphate isomerase/epimerase
VLILPHPTLNDLHPPDFVRIAKRTGYDAVNLRIFPFQPDAAAANVFADRALLRATVDALAETGMPVYDIEVIRIEEGMRVPDFRDLFEAGAELGARYAVAIGISADEAFVTERLAELAALAEPYGIRLVIEFMMRGGIRTLDAARRIVDATGRDDVGVLVDALHFYRSGATLDALASVDPQRLPYMQINDVRDFEQLRDARPVEDVVWKKVLPGEGNLRLRELLQTLPAGIPISIETPGPAEMSLADAEEYARHARACLQGVIA